MKNICRRLWRYFFAPRKFGCYCGQSYRTEKPLGAHMWQHALSEDE